MSSTMVEVCGSQSETHRPLSPCRFHFRFEASTGDSISPMAVITRLNDLGSGFPARSFNNGFGSNKSRCEGAPAMKASLEAGKVLTSKEFDVKQIDENSAKSFFNIEEKVLQDVDKKFFIDLVLTDKGGEVISKNDYLFLIGDQKAATARFKKWKLERLEQENQHGAYGSYYHFFREFTGQDGAKYESGTQTPRAIGFE